jgi:hypothetical protein
MVSYPYFGENPINGRTLMARSFSFFSSKDEIAFYDSPPPKLHAGHEQREKRRPQQIPVA